MLKLSSEIVNAFLDPCISVFEQVISTSGTLEVNDTYINKLKVSPYEVSVSSMVSGDLDGKIVLSVSTEMAMEIAEQMMGEMINSLNSDAQSAITELVTMIVGNASVKLSKLNHNIKMAPVEFSYGSHVEIGSVECPYPVSISIKSDLGIFELDLAFY